MRLPYFSVTNILILNGQEYESTKKRAVKEWRQPTKSGILSIIHCIPGSIFNLPDPLHARYQPTTNTFDGIEGCFAINCDSKIIVGAGHTQNGSRRNVFVFENNTFIEIQPLNGSRPWYAAAYYSSPLRNSENVLIVTGKCSYARSDIEYLVINDCLRSNKWQVCPDKLPNGVLEHQLNVLNNKLILTRGPYWGKCEDGWDIWKPNDLWEGTISFEPEFV